MSFDPASLLISIIISGIGWVAFKYGRKQQRTPQVVTGVLLMIYPYFVQSAVWMGAIGVALLGAMWAAIYLGL